MGKPRDTKIAILPSTTRKGTTLSTSAALDSPSVISKLVSPPQTSNAGTSAESENSSHNCDDASAVLDNDGSLGSFLDATIAKSRQIENTETPNENAATPVNSPESVEYSSDDLDEDYVELDDDFIEKCNATTDARKIKKLLAEHAVRYKLSPDPKFATSPINIRDKDYDFSLDLSHIAIVEKTPFCGTEKESAVEHMTELSTLSGLFSDDIKMRTYFVAKFFPFSLKDDAKTWYNNLPPGSIKSPKELLDVFSKYFPASAQHAALQRIYNFDQEDGEKLPEAWARFCSLIRAQPDHDLEKHDLLDIFYSGLTIESRAYLDSCAGCVFRKRTPDDAEELLAKIGRNHDDWSTPEPTPTPIVKKRGMIKLNDEDMREAKKSLKEKGIKPEDVKNLPPIEDLCEITPPSSMIEYMKDIVTNKRKVPNEEISTMLANYSFNGKIPKKLGDPDKLIPTDISLQMADKSTAIPVGLCENVPVQVTQHCLILTDFVVLEMPEDDNMSIILGRPFLNTAGAVIDCNKGMVTFNVDDKEHTVYFPKRIDKKGKMKKFKFGELFKKATTSTGRPSRASTQIRRSYNEDVIAPSFAPEEDNGAPNASSFPCYEFLTNAGILDDFFTLVNRAGLATYVGDEREQYYRLTKVFVESFKFHNTEYEPTVAFKIYDIPVTMKLEEFCRALGIAPVDMASSINFNQFLEKEKLKSNGSNFTDWFRHVRIFLNGGNLQYVLDAPLGDPPAETETDEVKNVYMTRKTRYSQVQCAILCSLESDLQKRFEHHDPHELIKELKTIFETHAAVECYEASKHFFSCMMEEGSSISEHMLVMTGHAKKLSDLGIVIPNRLGINRVLQSLPPSYKNFVMNYNMQNMNKEFPELFGMLKAAEIEIKKEHQVLMVNKTTSFKKQGKSKGKNKKSGKKAATPPVKPKSGPKPDAECYYCKEKGHWKRNCSKYLADLKSGLIKKKKEGISDIHVIDVYLTSSRSSTWVFDTGSVAHICNSKQELKNKRQLLKDEVTMRVGNGSKVNVIAVGTLPLHLPSGLVLSLNNCYYVPALSMNIISGSCLMQDGYSFKSENNGCSIFMNNIFYGRAPQKNGLFLLDLDSSDTHIHNIDAKRIKLNDNSTYMWHCRLGHIGVKRMKKLHTDGLLESLDFESLDRCEACLMGKMTKTPFSGMMERATDLLEIIHTDVCGPMSVASRGGYRYVLTFTDDLSRYGYIYLMKHKSETFEKFKEFQSEVENQRNKKIKFLRSDRGGEYLSYEFSMHLKKCGILSQLTPPGTPQRNGVSERRNRTLLDMVRSMMSLTDLPLSFWSYALETAAFTLNRAPSKSVETTPYELWFNKKPKLSFLKVWGCEAYVKKLQPDKLEPKAEKCVFIGYPKETIGYTFYHRSEGKIFVAKNGTFLEKEFLTKEVTGRKVELDEIEESLLVDQSSAVPENVPVPPTPATEEANDNDHETSNETATEPRRSTRDRATPDWYDPCLNVMIVDNNDEDPATYEEAMMSPDSNKWQEAMKSEMGSMYDNKVWTLVDLPDSRKAVENKWIFKRKTDADGNITVYKARLVAKGFRQIQGVDYDETFSPVAKLKSVRILLAIAAFFDYEIWQMDVKTAFLNGDIEEELYMVQPKGFVDPKNADKVCKLQRSIYGLKQASRSWNRRFDKVIKDFGFIQCHGEACIYKKVSGSSVAFLILYVDDILLIGNDIELLSSVKGYLNNSFSMKDLGEASYILGIKIYRDRSRRLIGLSQSTYLDKILKKFRMDESKKGFLPMLPGKVLSKTQGPATAEERERMSQIPYASAVGSIMYAMLCTRPDIAHAVSLTSRYQSDPGMEHWTAVKNILKYLKRTKDMFLCYGGDQELVVTSYTDASWNTDPDDSKSQSGYVFILNGAAVSWASSKQCTVAKSSTESEYIAASEASSEAVWMKRFIIELGVVPSALDPFVIYCDNMGAIANAQEPRSHKRLKHIKLRYHSIREYIEDGEVKICKVHTDLNVADPLTKALPRAKHDQHQNAMGVRITGDDCRTIQRGKIRNIQLPAIKYFAYYIATSILGRENTSNISSYHLAFLNVALTGETPYHLGSLIARRLSSRGPIFGGTIALRILTHLDIPLDSNDVPLTPRRLDIAAMKSHHFVTTDSTIDNMVYRMLFADGNEKEIPLPQQGLFNIDRQSWSLTKEVVEEHMKIQEFHQQHDSENAEPSYDYTVTYPDVSSSTYLEPGRSSSYYGDTTSWGPWE
ncbi:hypothetical protein QYE76_033461 [Lolium multiflorum]|uniref:Gag-pol polyprotein n=1 Tax=Lolium multiflorum TaxID=4521 RepID=A0AAD8QVH6_LOLMU|nr:hypothetical protein QYE76_033461 [Lolium multiflorum]